MIRRRNSTRTCVKGVKGDWALYGMIAALVIGAQILWWATQALDCDHELKFGVFAASMSLLSMLVVSVYWWRIYRERGLQARPRISFREIYVLYFGMSVEVGLIVNCVTSPHDLALACFAIALPPILIGVIALMDDTPDAQAVRLRLAAAKAALAAPSARPPSQGGGSSSHKKRRRKLAHARARLKLKQEKQEKLDRAERRAAAAARKAPAARPAARAEAQGWRIVGTPVEATPARLTDPATSNETFTGRSAAALQQTVLALFAKPRRV